MADKQRLSAETLEDLLPGSILTIGKQDVTIKPLGVLRLALISRKLKKFIGELKESGITFDNCKEPEHIIDIASELLERFPEVLEEATDIHVDDVKQLPIEAIISLLDKVIEVNMASNKSFLGNFKSLINKIVPQNSLDEAQTETPKTKGKKKKRR